MHDAHSPCQLPLRDPLSSEPGGNKGERRLMDSTERGRGVLPFFSFWLSSFPFFGFLNFPTIYFIFLNLWLIYSVPVNFEIAIVLYWAILKITSLHFTFPLPPPFPCFFSLLLRLSLLPLIFRIFMSPTIDPSFTPLLFLFRSLFVIVNHYLSSH